MLKPTAMGFDTVFQRELELIAKRRKDGDPAPAAKLDLWGLALSGGGIRSAAFNLGLLQALAKHEVLQRCDYLSTVSGGGYIGACLSSLTATGPADATSGGFPFDVGGSVERPEVQHLREHSEYLVPRAGLLRLGTWRAISTYLGGAPVHAVDGRRDAGDRRRARHRGVSSHPRVREGVARPRAR